MRIATTAAALQAMIRATSVGSARISIGNHSMDEILLLARDGKLSMLATDGQLFAASTRTTDAIIHEEGSFGLRRQVMAGFCMIAEGQVGIQRQSAGLVMTNKDHRVVAREIVGLDVEWPKQSDKTEIAVVNEDDTLALRLAMRWESNRGSDWPMRFGIKGETLGLCMANTRGGIVRGVIEEKQWLVHPAVMSRVGVDKGDRIVLGDRIVVERADGIYSLPLSADSARDGYAVIRKCQSESVSVVRVLREPLLKALKAAGCCVATGLAGIGNVTLECSCGQFIVHGQGISNETELHLVVSGTVEGEPEWEVIVPAEQAVSVLELMPAEVCVEYSGVAKPLMFTADKGSTAVALMPIMKGLESGPPT